MVFHWVRTSPRLEKQLSLFGKIGRKMEIEALFCENYVAQNWDDFEQFSKRKSTVGKTNYLFGEYLPRKLMVEESWVY